MTFARSRWTAASRWSSIGAFGVSAFYASTVVWLLVWVVLPVVTGLRPVVISSESMQPRIGAGDVVLVASPRYARPTRGSVITFRDPGVPGRLLTHRVIGRNADGTYQTKGDANPAADSSPVDPGQIKGVGRYLVPVVGLPAMWLRSGDLLYFVIWLIASLLAFAYVHAFPRCASLAGWSSSIRVRPQRGRRRGPAAQTAPGTSSERAGWSTALDDVTVTAGRRVPIPAGIAAAIITVVALVGIALPAMSSAAWSAQAQNAGSSLGASGCFPRTVTVTPTADTVVRQDLPTTAAGTGSSVAIQSGKDANWRALVRFNLPTDTGTCSISASLRLYLHTGVAGRSVVANRATATWGETTVTWNTQPATGTTSATSAGFTAIGWVPVDVSALVSQQYAQGNNGFVLRDSVENKNPGAETNYFYSREGTYPPQLVLTLS